MEEYHDKRENFVEEEDAKQENEKTEKYYIAKLWRDDQDSNQKKQWQKSW